MLCAADAELFDAAMRGDAETGVAALSAGANVEAKNANGLCALLVLAAGGPGGAPLLEALLAAGAAHDVADAQGWSATVYAASGGVLPLLSPLLAAARQRGGGSSSGGSSTGGWTPLARAAYRGHAAAVELILSDGADPLELAEGRTPREWALSAGHASVAEAIERAEAGGGAAATSGAAAKPIASDGGA